jgi:ribonuclease P protein component
MKKERRITSNIEFQSIIQHKRYVTNGSFVVYVKRRKLDYSRVGISVSKKLGSAVERNKVKRQVRMMLQNLFKSKLNYDAVIIVRQNYLTKAYDENEKLLENVLNKVKL